MKVILLSDVKNQGKKDDVIEVSDGYAHNFLIKKGLAIKYTEGSKNKLEQELADKNQKEVDLIKNCEKIKTELEKKELIFKVKVGKEGKLFGSVSTKQISDELNKIGFKIDKKLIEVKTPIDSLGSYIININLHKKVIAQVKINVVD